MMKKSIFHSPKDKINEGKGACISSETHGKQKIETLRHREAQRAPLFKYFCKVKKKNSIKAKPSVLLCISVFQFRHGFLRTYI